MDFFTVLLMAEKEKDIIELVDVFYLGTLDIKGANYGVLTLLHKTQDAFKIQQYYRPICLPKG